MTFNLIGARSRLMRSITFGWIRILVSALLIPPYHILLLHPLVVAVRDPLAVATSLHARNGFSLNRGLVLWWIYNHHIAAQLCSKDLVIVPYGNLLALDDQGLQQLLDHFLNSIATRDHLVTKQES